MKGKMPLSILKRISVALVLVVIAFFCLIAFLVAKKLSYSTHAMGWAVTEAESIAEDLMGQSDATAMPVPAKGNLQADGQWIITYDEEWNQTEQKMVYYALIKLEESEEYSWRGKISMYMKNGALLYELPVYGQK